VSELIKSRQAIGFGRICSNCKSSETQITITKKGYPHAKWINDGNNGWLCHKCARVILYKQGKRAPSRDNKNIPLRNNPKIVKHTNTVCFLCGSTETYRPQNKYYHWFRYSEDSYICAKCYWKQRRRNNGEFQDFKTKLNQRICSNCKSDKTQITITKRGYPNKKWIGDGKGGWLCHKCAKKITYHRQEVMRVRRAMIKNPRFYWARMSLGNHKRSGFSIDLNMFEELLPLAMSSNTCKICDVSLSWGYHNGKQLMTTPSLDRINNEKHITKDNIQIICYRCNSTKRDRSMSDFISYCKYVAKKFS
jgi:hypothetical protein